MSELAVQKKILLGTFAVSTLLVPIIFGVSAQSPGDPVPVVRIAPDYPSEALAAKREGFAQLEFTIAANGTTKDIIVVDSSSPEFEEPAVNALLRWRYLPTNVTCVGTDCQPNPNVQAVERPGIRTVIRYELAPEGQPPP